MTQRGGGVGVAPSGLVSSFDGHVGAVTLANTDLDRVRAIVSKTANYTAADGDYVVGDTTGGAFTVTLPAAVAGGYIVVELRTGSAALTVHNLLGGDVVLTGARAGALCFSDGTNWHAIVSEGSGTYVQPDVIAHKPTGVVGTDRPMLLAAIAACPAGGWLQLPGGGSTPYAIDQALVIAKAMKVTGAGVLEQYGSLATDFNSINAPTGTPPLLGSVLMQTAAATDILQLTGAGVRVDLADFGMMFSGSSVQFQNTGRGVYVNPPVYGSYQDNGLMAPRWSNLTVFGHDGNHYAFDITNSLYGQFGHLHAFGGGLLRFNVNGAPSGGSAQFYGGATFTEIYGQVFALGSAHGIHLKATSSTPLNLVFHRPQVTVSNMTTTFPLATAPTSAQDIVHLDDAVRSVTFQGEDFETNVGSGVHLGASHSVWTDPTGIVPSALPVFVGALNLKQYNSGSRPVASTVPQGAQIFDTTLGKPLWSDGTIYRDAAGNPGGFPTGLQLWLGTNGALYQDSARTTPVTADGQPVGSWTDLSDNGNNVGQFTGTFKPTWKNAIQNGWSVIRFNGTNNYLQLGAFAGTNPLAQPIYVFVAGRLAVAAGTFLDSDSGAEVTLGVSGGSKFNIYAGTELDGAAADTAWHVHTGKFNGASSQIWLDGTSSATGAAGAGTMSGINIGANVTPGSYLNGDIGELLIFTGSLTAAQVATIQAYLKSRWGTP